MSTMGDVTQFLLGDGLTIQAMRNGPSHRFCRQASELLAQIARDQERSLGDLDLTENKKLSSTAAHRLRRLETLASEILTFSGPPLEREPQSVRDLNAW
jgi:hypothetical protein